MATAKSVTWLKFLDFVRVAEMGDARGLPSPICPYCDCELIKITAKFDPATYEISMYLLDDAICAGCGALLTAPTPEDLPAA